MSKNLKVGGKVRYQKEEGVVTEVVDELKCVRVRFANNRVMRIPWDDVKSAGDDDDAKDKAAASRGRVVGGRTAADGTPSNDQETAGSTYRGDRTPSGSEGTAGPGANFPVHKQIEGPTKE